MSEDSLCTCTVLSRLAAPQRRYIGHDHCAGREKLHKRGRGSLQQLGTGKESGCDCFFTQRADRAEGGHSRRITTVRRSGQAILPEASWTLSPVESRNQDVADHKQVPHRVLPIQHSVLGKVTLAN